MTVISNYARQKVRRLASLLTPVGRLTYRIEHGLDTGSLGDCGVRRGGGHFLYAAAMNAASRGGTVVEIGSCYGRSTLFLAGGLRRRDSGKVWAIDPHTGDIFWASQGKTVNTYDIFQRNVRKFGMERWVKPLRMTSREAAAQWDGRPIHLLFIDWLHTYDAVREDIRLWLPLLVPSSVVVFDDYYNAEFPGVRQAIDDQLTSDSVDLPLQRADHLAWTTKK